MNLNFLLALLIYGGMFFGLSQIVLDLFGLDPSWKVGLALFFMSPSLGFIAWKITRVKH